ncbi:DNA-binding response regulator [Solemya pervernicosa gill symbiont]|uniref:DNA-binding response regulator n=2 Tax=Gammaproteobacteria incertae sedis TaxID=118884 RepID=A0A1T2LAY4_9GAMM|nr:response regulator FixJ [Candidatus Reidiella endopervernicosa]OOZ42268.1 DNA-binding response regulator [Solemya pervernicosa gill symbiont]QKQ25665.1 response regulator transcription factor [Candidatus Reidiella endopervernicosa]
MSNEATVFIVDDDEAVRDSLQWLMRSVGLAVETFPSANDFLEGYERERSGCLVLDIRMPGMGGLDLQEQLAAEQVRLPVIFITGHGDVPIAVRALKAGAVDFIEKPFKDQALLDSVQRAIALDEEQRHETGLQADISARLKLLTPREREVMEMVVHGSANKVIAIELGVTQKTVEAHRAKVMEKMEARSLSELVRMRLSVD